MRRLIQICLLAAAMLAPALARAQIEVQRVADHENLLDPKIAFWQAIPAVSVAMLPQVVTTPRHPNNAVKEIKVRAVHNGHWIAFHLEWKDPTRSDRIVVDQFGDQVAVEMPVKFDKDALPSPMMGHSGARVDIWQWRAAFQHDLDEGEPQVRDLYPYAQVDGYPDQVLRATDARPYTGALGVDNPISHPLRTSVLDQSSEGWGTMTVEPDQDADGRGVWENGVWCVVIVHPMATTSSENDIHLFPGDESVAAFAVWDGGHREVGSRKAWSNWAPVRLQK